MAATVSIHDKATGELVDEIKVEARPHADNYQAMIAWNGISKIASGNSIDEAIQNAFDKFRGLAVLDKYDIRLSHRVAR